MGYTEAMTIRRQIAKILQKETVRRWPEAGDVPVEVVGTDTRFGQYATNLALRLAPVVKDNPIRIAEKLAKAFASGKPATAQVVAPGFLNFTLPEATLKRLPSAILKKGKTYGQSDLGQKARVHLEFISANPTGPLHLGNGRGAFVGDVLGNVLAAAGYKVWREYYINDIGKQVQTLAESVVRKYFIQQGITMDYPDTCYQGAYVDELAAKLKLDGAKADMRKLRDRVQNRVLNDMLKSIQTLVEKRLGIQFDRWFRESELYQAKLDEKVLKRLAAAGVLYEADGARWMKTTTAGDDKDRVLVKSDGEKTYFLSDVAYLDDKFNRRRFDRAIVLLGADHHGYVGRFKAAAGSLGHPGKLEIIIFQLVRLIKGGQEIKMSKRAGTFVTLDELIDEVGPDVARFFFLASGSGTHMDFDLDLAKERSEKNPVYYVQYAHARIASLVTKAEGLLKVKGSKDSRVLGSKGRTVKGEFGENERKLAALLLRLPDVVEDVARSYGVQQLPQYATDLARAFHDYYDKARVIDNDVVNLARLQLMQATQQVLKNTLALMGVSAPERM